ncbi:hypothetical protein PC114_g25309, partial [Phytophthora cactorum]
EKRGRWEDVVIAQRLDQMARRLEQLEQDNHELRRRVRHREESRDVQPQHERWQHQRRWG